MILIGAPSYALMSQARIIIFNYLLSRSINPSENKTVAVLAMGEGWHNYHHTFPWDYKTAELGNYRFNLTTAFIDFMAAIGWAYDLKTVPKSLVLSRISRTGDGSHAEHPQTHHHEPSHNGHHHVHEEGAPWGWGDKDIKPEDADLTETLHRLESPTPAQAQ